MKRKIIFIMSLGFSFAPALFAGSFNYEPVKMTGERSLSATMEEAPGATRCSGLDKVYSEASESSTFERQTGSSGAQ